MKLFENGVGRPSNETLKKRRVFILVAVLIVIGLIAGVTYVLTTTSTEKTTGSTFNSKYGSTTATLVGTNIVKILERKMTGDGSDSVTVDGGIDNDGIIDYILGKDSNISITYKIKNTTKVTLYYAFSSDDDVLKSGTIKAGKTLSGVFKTKVKYENNKTKRLHFAVSGQQYLKGDESLGGIAELIRPFSYHYVFHCNKYYIHADDDIYKLYENKASPITYKADTFTVGNTIINDVPVDDSGSSSSDKVYYSSQFHLFNRSVLTRYYKLFSYENVSYDKLNSAKGSSDGNCSGVFALSNKYTNRIKTMVNSNKTGTLRVKVYDKLSNCKKDTSGTSSKGVVYDMADYVHYE